MTVYDREGLGRHHSLRGCPRQHRNPGTLLVSLVKRMPFHLLTLCDWRGYLSFGSLVIDVDNTIYWRTSYYPGLKYLSLDFGELSLICQIF